MFNLVQKRRWYFLISGTAILLALGMMIYSTITKGAPFELSIDFVGGSIYDLRFTSEGATESNIRQVFARYGEDNIIVQRLGQATDYRWLIVGNFPDEAPLQPVFTALENITPYQREYLDGDRYRLVYTRPEVTVDAIQTAFDAQNIPVTDIEPLTEDRWLVRGNLADNLIIEPALTQLREIGRVELVPQSGSVFVFRFTDFIPPAQFRPIFAENGDANPTIVRLGTQEDHHWLVYSSITDEASLRTIFDKLGELSPLITDESRYEVMGENRYELRFTLPVIGDTLIQNVIASYPNLRVERIGAGSDLTWLLWGKFADNAQRDAVLNGLAFAPLQITLIPLDAYLLTSKENLFTSENLAQAFADGGFANVQIERVGGDVEFRWSIRGAFESQEVTQNILTDLGRLATLDTTSARARNVSETVGQEVTRSAIWAVLFSMIVITGFIVLAFRQVPKATRYGICAIVAMVHDVLIVMGFTSLMGLLLGWQIDALFLTAILTVVGFSVQDSIVMFDRIRENIPKHLGEPYETIVNRSVWETIHRSLATQLNAFFIMVAILLFGGETIKQFIAILFVGLLTGTYSSIFIAVPLLVSWEKGEIPFLKGDEELASAK
ncbi:MAG: protein translocase subunit SecF [Phototrophicales bacterium]|nr:MAG: protein translocase subunit SecF [Phototrophicales bacterium]